MHKHHVDNKCFRHTVKRFVYKVCSRHSASQALKFSFQLFSYHLFALSFHILIRLQNPCLAAADIWTPLYQWSLDLSCVCLIDTALVAHNTVCSNILPCHFQSSFSPLFGACGAAISTSPWLRAHNWHSCPKSWPLTWNKPSWNGNSGWVGGGRGNTGLVFFQFKVQKKKKRQSGSFEVNMCNV